MISRLTNLARHWRIGQLVLVLLCVGMMGYALYEQIYHYLMPCLMCVYQRIAVIGFGLASLLGLVWKPSSKTGVLGVAGLQTLAAAEGLYAAGKHIYLQYGPKLQEVSCAAGLPFPVDFNQPGLPEWIPMTFRPVGECNNIDFTLLGVSMPMWVLVGFIGMLAAAWLLSLARWKVLAKAG